MGSYAATITAIDEAISSGLTVGEIAIGSRRHRYQSLKDLLELRKYYVGLENAEVTATGSAKLGVKFFKTKPPGTI